MNPQHIPLAFTLAILSLIDSSLLSAQQRTITFSAKHRTTLETISLDSVRVFNISKGRDTLLIGSSPFDIDWLTALDRHGLPLTDFSLQEEFGKKSSGRIGFRISMPSHATVALSAHSLSGKAIVAQSVLLAPGMHSFSFETGEVSAGIYFITAALEGVSQTIKVVTTKRGAEGIPRIVQTGSTPLHETPYRKPMTDRYTFIGYARRFFPDTIANIIPQQGSNQEFHLAPMPQNSLVTGSSIEVARTDIPIQGGKAIVQTPNTPITGMEIDVMKNSYPDARTYTISYAEILNHSFDEKIKVLSPLITISNGGGYADSAMLIKIPISLPNDHFAMCFFYDPVTNDLEGIPIVALTDTAIWIMTRHLSSDQLVFGKTSPRSRAGNWVNVLTLGIRNGELTNKISTDFKPGVDDWEFINFGSYLAPAGHCTGQSLTAMWYYTFKKMRGGANPIFNMLDQVHADSMWMDNPYGYRFASVVQKGTNPGNRNAWQLDHFEKTAEGKMTKDWLHYSAFAFSMKTTQDPQLVEIWRKTGPRTWSGHAMIVYESEGGKIKIADPNYPGKQRETGIDRGNWIPYSSGDNGGNLGVQYPYIYYIAKTAEISYSDIANRWKETAEKTIGTIEPHTFPKTELFHVSDNTTKALPDVIETMADTIVVVATCPTCVDKYQNDYTPILLTDAQGKFISWTNGEGKLLIPTKPGTTKFGLAVHGYSEAGKKGLGYIDFKWLTIKRNTYIKATVVSGPLDGHFRNEDNGVISYHDAPVELTSVSTGPEAGVYGSFKNRTYTWDTTYTVMGNFTHTQSIRVTLDDSMTTVKDYRISWTRTQAGEWTETTTVTGGDVQRDAASSSDTQDTFVLSGAVACTKITSVVNSTTRLDRNYKTILESYRCNASSKVRISLGKQ